MVAVALCGGGGVVWWWWHCGVVVALRGGGGIVWIRKLQIICQILEAKIFGCKPARFSYQRVQLGRTKCAGLKTK